MAPSILRNIDSVYFFMFPGWRNELRSNRWHFARRWARHRPVVLIQPDREARAEPTAEPEPRIPGATIVSVRRVMPGPTFRDDAARMVHQLAGTVRDAGHRRPLFWLYNPLLFAAYAALPATLRIYHATENYWDFENRDATLTDLMPRAMGASDCVVAVSTGVEEAVREHVPGARVWELSNGCDYQEYANAPPSPRLKSDGSSFERIAIYCGNINGRLELDLLERCVKECPRVFFALVGPVAGLSPPDQAVWEQLLRAPNARAYGAVPPEDLPGLYAAADVGLIPYKQTPIIEKNGFPLKALEMTAAGLPVVSTFMRPLQEIAQVVSIARTDDEFVGALKTTSRAWLTAERRSAMSTEAQKRDYDVRFSELLARISGELPHRDRPVTHLDALALTLTTEELLAAAIRFGEPCADTVERCARGVARGAMNRTRKRIMSTMWGWTR